VQNGDRTQYAGLVGEIARAALPLLPANFVLPPELDPRKRDQEAHSKASRYRDPTAFL
jgi:hypothetical protein